jgi:hypothetical protein
MRTATVREFRDRATVLLRGTDPILVTRRGKIVGFFVPATGTVVPLDIRREIFHAVTSAVRRMVRSRGLSEKAIIADFEATRKTRRRR